MKVPGLVLIVLALAACGEEPSAPRTAHAPTTPALPARVPATEAPSEEAPRQVPPSREQRGRAAALLARGRRAARAGNHADALALYRQALAINRDHPGSLCEAGWSAFHVDDPQAREYLETGAALMNAPQRRAACLYNLGRWWERRAERSPEGDRETCRAAAIRAYGDSLSLRPDNAETQSRYRSLTGEDYRAVCPPAQRFASIEQMCATLLPINHADQPEGRAWCGTSDDFDVPTEGEGAGTLLAVGDAEEYADMTTWYLVHRVDDGFHILGELGVAWDRDCSSGEITVTRARWIAVEGVAPLLVVEIHETGSYACAPSEWDTCLEGAELEGRDTSTCDGLDDDSEESTYVRYRMICASRAGRYRCSVGGGSLQGIRPSARPGPIPEGAALEALLACPPR